MARAPRLALAGELHYVMQRGHNRQRVFVDDQDRQAYLTMLQEAAAQHGVAVHAYALLEVGVHLLATPRQAESLSRTMQSLGRRFVAASNRRHQRSGTLWEGRFRAGLVDGDTLGLDAVLLVESQPVLTGLVTAASDWPWSSAQHHLGRRRDPLVTEHGAYWRLGNTPFEREVAHRQLLARGLSPPQALRIREALLKGWALGEASFVASLGKDTKRRTGPLRRGRPIGTSRGRAD